MCNPAHIMQHCAQAHLGGLLTKRLSNAWLHSWGAGQGLILLLDAQGLSTFFPGSTCLRTPRPALVCYRAMVWAEWPQICGVSLTIPLLPMQGMRGPRSCTLTEQNASRCIAGARSVVLCPQRPSQAMPAYLCQYCSRVLSIGASQSAAAVRAVCRIQSPSCCSTLLQACCSAHLQACCACNPTCTQAVSSSEA